jgi:sodium pump decarboxylase gamma subunit
MIIAGLKLVLLGMGSVISFLFLLYFLVMLSSKLLSVWSAEEFFAMEASDRERRKKAFVNQGDETLVAVISAAIVAHRSRAER